MEYQTAAEILNRHIFDGDKASLLRNIAERPERFTGLFRPTKPKAKILQNLLQSHEIRFGDAMEELIKAILRDLGFTILPTRALGGEGEDLSIDQYFSSGTRYYFVEQKVRDDHDSTKKRGQIDNFESKLETLQKLHGPNLVGIMYFIDPDLMKNKRFYSQKLFEYSEFYGVELHLFYGSDLFAYLGLPGLWTDLINWLQQWKDALPDLPEINLDLTPEASFQEIKDLENRTWRKVITNDVLWDQAIMAALFREGITLRLILEYFNQKDTPPYLHLARDLSEKLDKYY